MQDGNRFAITSSNAAITNNSSANGGGVYLDTSSTFNIASGSITNNTVTANGGGVYFAGSAFNISGSADISENVKGGTISNGSLSGGTANNIYLPNNKTITITDALTGTNKIGVTTEAIPNTSSYVTIAGGNTNYVHPYNFQYENDDTPISVITNGNNATLVACKHSRGTEWVSDSINHWHKCSICEGKADTAAHSGGTATCQAKAVCDTCKQPYGALGSHNPAATWSKDASGHWYACQTANCNEIGRASCRERV